MFLPPPQEDCGLPVDQTTISSEVCLMQLTGSHYSQLVQSVQTIAEELMKFLKDSTLANSKTVQEFQQITHTPDKMAADRTKKQQQKISPKNQQADINNC